jgi:hypothetical protein
LFPRFHIIRRDAGEILGSVTSTTFGTETWVRDECLGCLMAEERFIFGRWHKGGYARRNFWAFVPDDPAVIERLLPDTEWAILDGYWGERAELVLDTTRKWQRSLYDDSDHDHCAICWQTLGQGGQPDGYVSEDATWICCRCYESFVAPRSLDFIPRPKPQ